MAGETVINFVGNLVADPDLRFTPSGVAVANFRVASTPRAFDRQANEWRDGEARFLSCHAWRDLAEHVAESLTRGDRVVVTGRLVPRSWEKDGEKRTQLEVDVDEVGPSLRYATAKVTKATGQRVQDRGQQRQGTAEDHPWAQPGGQQQSGWGQPQPRYDETPF